MQKITQQMTLSVGNIQKRQIQKVVSWRSGEEAGLVAKDLGDGDLGEGGGVFGGGTGGCCKCYETDLWGQSHSSAHVLKSCELHNENPSVMLYKLNLNKQHKKMCVRQLVMSAG